MRPQNNLGDSSRLINIPERPAAGSVSTAQVVNPRPYGRRPIGIEEETDE